MLIFSKKVYLKVQLMYHTHLGKAGMKWWCQSFKAAMLVRVNNAWWVNFSSKLSNASSSICDNNNGTICWNKKTFK